MLKEELASLTSSTSPSPPDGQALPSDQRPPPQEEQPSHGDLLSPSSARFSDSTAVECPNEPSHKNLTLPTSLSASPVVSNGTSQTLLKLNPSNVERVVV